MSARVIKLEKIFVKLLLKGRLDMYILKLVAYILVIIGALNWGLVGFFNFDLVAMILGDMTLVSRIVYDIIGVAAIVYLVMSYRDLGNRY